MRTSRRSVLIGLGATGIAATAFFALRADEDRFGVFSDAEAAKTIGRAYIAEHGAPDDLTALRATLDDTDEDRALGVVRARIRADFEAGRTVVIQGWYLSRTEADLCALVAGA